MSETMVMNDLVDELCAAGRIGADDILALRRAVYADGVTSMEEAQSVFRLDRECSDKDPSWTDFYVQALTDFFVWQAKPKGYVSDELAGHLIRAVEQDGHIDRMSELELLIHVIDRATSAPEALALFVMQAVRDSVLNPGSAAYGSNRPPALITAADAAIIRKVIHAPGGDNSIAVTRREAEFLFDLNDAVDAENADPEWNDVFVKAVACHLMSPSPEPMEMTAEAELKRQAWLEEGPAPFGTTLAGVGKALTKGDIPFAEAWREVDPGGYRAAREFREAEAKWIDDAFARETIDPAEAAWLADRLGRDGVLKDNERALLKFIKDNAPQIDAALEPLIAKAGH